jgi:hypothetical protein
MPQQGVEQRCIVSMQDSNLQNICCVEIFLHLKKCFCRGVKSTVFQPMDCAVQASHNSGSHVVPLILNIWICKKNKTPLFATVFVVLSILLYVSAYIRQLQVLRIQNVKRTAVCNTNGSVTITYYYYYYLIESKRNRMHQTRIKIWLCGNPGSHVLLSQECCLPICCYG